MPAERRPSRAPWSVRATQARRTVSSDRCSRPRTPPSVGSDGRTSAPHPDPRRYRGSAATRCRAGFATAVSLPPGSPGSRWVAPTRATRRGATWPGCACHPGRRTSPPRSTTRAPCPASGSGRSRRPPGPVCGAGRDASEQCGTRCEPAPRASAAPSPGASAGPRMAGTRPPPASVRSGRSRTGAQPRPPARAPESCLTEGSAARPRAVFRVSKKGRPARRRKGLSADGPPPRPWLLAPSRSAACGPDERCRPPWQAEAVCFPVTARPRRPAAFSCRA